MAKKKHRKFGPHVQRLYDASTELIRSGMAEKVKPAAIVAGGILTGVRMTLDHPAEAQALMDEIHFPLGVTEELMRNASLLATGRTGGRPPGGKRTH